MVLEDVFRQDKLQQIQLVSDRLMTSEAAKLLGAKPNSPKCLPFGYKTLQASKWPCTCRYRFAGNQRHTFYQYGKPSRNLALGPRPGDAEQLPGLTDLSSLLEAGLRERMRGTLFSSRGTSSSSMPDYVVMNRYHHPEAMIGEHHDADPIFDAVANQAVILSFNLQADGIMFLKPQTKGEVSEYLSRETDCHRPSHIRDWGLTHPVYLPENSLLVMGGWCQAALLHRTLSHSSIMAYPNVSSDSPA